MGYGTAASPGVRASLRSVGVRSLVGLLRGYQRLVSPLLVAIFGPQAGCRFSPSCSQYAIECFQLHPFFRALLLTLKRLGRCQPFCPGGFDPVPRPRHPLSQ